MFGNRLIAAARTFFLFTTLPFVLAGCTGKSEDVSPASDTQNFIFSDVPSPAASNSQFPFLSVRKDGGLLMSWLHRNPSGEHSLLYSQWNGNSWDAPKVIATGSDWFVNWADFPSVVSMDSDILFAHLLEKSGAGTYAYDAKWTLSRNDGATWTKPQALHNDQTETEHGFVSLLPVSTNQLLAVWLDGRNTAGTVDGDHHGSSGAMTLRAAFLDSSGTVARETLLDERTCDCCQTATAMTEGGPVVVYRDRSAEEVRDISIVRYENGTWSAPKTIHDDNWIVAGCPVNGPAISATTGNLAVAWYTEANDQPTVNVSFSFDQGRSFSNPVRVDAGSPIGRVDIKHIDHDAILVSWIEKTAEGANLMVRSVNVKGQAGTPQMVSSINPGRTSGFPRLVISADQVWTAWTVPGDIPEVVVRKAVLEGLR